MSHVYLKSSYLNIMGGNDKFEVNFYDEMTTNNILYFIWLGFKKYLR